MSVGVSYRFWVVMRKQVLKAIMNEETYESVRKFIARRNLVADGNECPFCGRVFKRRYALKIHIQAVHNKEID